MYNTYELLFFRGVFTRCAISLLLFAFLLSSCARPDAPKIQDASASESDEEIKFKVSLGYSANSNISFSYRVREGTASANTDYSTTSGGLVIKANSDSAKITIAISNDTNIEDSEFFFIELLEHSTDTIIDKAKGTIFDDDFPRLSIADATASESAGSMQFKVSLSESYPYGDVLFDYHTQRGSANSQTSWQRATNGANWDKRSAHSSVVFKGKIWLLGGLGDSNSYKNDVWYSSNGKTWMLATSDANWDKRKAHTSVVFEPDSSGDRIWVLGGANNITNEYYNDIWSSKNGTIWELATSASWSGRFGHSSLVFEPDSSGDRIWVLGGIAKSNDSTSIKNDVWSSNNGKNWLQATDDAGWSARHGHSSLVFDSKIWVLGGLGDSNNYKNDVWYSENGVAWTQATDNDSWSARHGHSSVVFNNKIWLLGGNGENAFKNDIWSSDGADWLQATDNASWSARSSHSSVVFDNKIWVLGGYQSASFFNDSYFFSIKDYQGVSAGKGRIAEGDSSFDINIQIDSDIFIESDESFDVVITGPVNATIDTNETTGTNKATGTIKDTTRDNPINP